MTYPAEHYTISAITADEMPTIIEWAAREGWNPGLNDHQCFYVSDPGGFFAGRINNQIISVGSAVNYGAEYSFLGLYIVDPKFRSRGLGMPITQTLLSHIGDRNAGIDGVVEMVDKYKEIGFHLAHNNARYACQGAKQSKIDERIVDANTIPFDLITTYDFLHFRAPRAEFLQCWINQPNSIAKIYLINEQVFGFITLRKCRHGYKVGPLFAENYSIAESLFRFALDHAGDEMIYLDIPVPNMNAIKLTEVFKMQQVFATARMYLHEDPKLPLEKIYGITSFELG